MLQLYYAPSTAAMAPHILLEEIGQPFALQLVDNTNGAHKTPAYLRLNPNGLIPALTDGDMVLYEAAAICLHLCDAYPQAGLAPAVGTVQRAHFYKWLVWMTNTLQTSLIAYFYPQRMVNPDNTAGSAEVQAQAELRVGSQLLQLDAELARHGGPYLLGQTYSALDAYALMLCRWTRGFASTPARNYPHLGPYLQNLLQRPAVQRAFASEKLAQPWV
jgi:glutathione S-transferase